MELHGSNFVGRQITREGKETFRAINPSGSLPLEPQFYEATLNEVDRALRSAEEAFYLYRRRSPEERAAFLERIADEILNLGDPLIERANAETALPADRLTGERARTANQFRMFAGLVREGSWVEARIDRPVPDRKPLPKPDVRRMLIPIGPVAVFGASNFPLAFSVAGGDTASALAAGNPVVIKAHPAHPGTSELVARAIRQAVESLGFPDGVFSMVHGTSTRVGLELVRHPLTRAVAFTGSLKGGRALFDAAAARPAPIPVFAEMGSINPVFVLPSVLRARAEVIAEGFKQSLTLGVGQFCTNPGVVVGLQDENLGRFTRKLSELISATPPGTMLHQGICQAYRESVHRFREAPGVRVLAESNGGASRGKTEAQTIMFAAEARTFLSNPSLSEEVFGPSTLLVTCGSAGEMEEIARNLEGHLTATIHGTEDDLHEYRSLLDILQDKVGRLIFNGFPTGVEVCPSIHHGGPYPATTDARETSVGTAAIRRFARPVCYQNFPQEAVPPELQNKNGRRIWRLVDGEFTREDVDG